MSFKPKSLDQLLNHFKLRNMLGSLVHEFWCDWSKTVAREEQLSPERLKRWREYWVPFDQLTTDMQEIDRQYADRIIETLKTYIVEIARGRVPR